MAVQLKRIYEPSVKTDGYRILVDRLWPRGIKKDDARIDLWMKEVAPSTNLRKWFHEGKGSWEQFRTKYLQELKDSAAAEELRAYAKEYKTITLLYAAKDEQHNHALVLKEFVKE